ncbi:MAG TPA: hypothetical protein VH142_07075, partial [Polyangiaceae bacterium]|nr:hypothetical protein [Polyangiaceae bacterium]
REQVKEFLAKNPRYAGPLHKAPHKYAGTGADLVAEIAPLIKLTRGERLRARLLGAAKKTQTAVTSAPHLVVELYKNAKEQAPALASRVKEDLTILRDQRKAKKSAPADLSAAAE